MIILNIIDTNVKEKVKEQEIKINLEILINYKIKEGRV